MSNPLANETIDTNVAPTSTGPTGILIKTINAYPATGSFVPADAKDDAWTIHLPPEDVEFSSTDTDGEKWHAELVEGLPENAVNGYDVLVAGNGAAISLLNDDQHVFLQSHWGSGVKFEVISFIPKPQPVVSAKKTSVLPSVLLILFVLLLLGGFAYHLSAQWEHSGLTAGKRSHDALHGTNLPFPYFLMEPIPVTSLYRTTGDSNAGVRVVKDDDSIMYGKHGGPIITATIRRVPSYSGMASRFKTQDGQYRYETIIIPNQSAWQFVYDPPWVAVFGTITAGQNYHGIAFSGRIPDGCDDYFGAKHTTLQIRNHIFDGSQITDADIEHINFINCSMQCTNFSGSRLRAVRFDKCDLSYSRFIDTYLEGYNDLDTSMYLPCDLSTAKGLELWMIKETKNYREKGPTFFRYDCVRLPPDIQKALDKEKKAQDAKKEKQQ